MNSDQLIKFKALAEHNTLTEAAESLYITQSALSQSLKKLEDELGCKLFTRQQNRLIINADGLKLLKYANSIFSTINKAEEDFKSSNIINIASINVCAAFMLKTMPKEEILNIRLKEVEEKDMPLLLANEEIDIAACDDYYMNQLKIPELQKYLLCVEQLALLVPDDHPLYDKKFIELKDLDELPLCTRADIPSQLHWIHNIVDTHPEIRFRLDFMMERYTFGYIRDEIPYPEILSTNSIIDLDPPVTSKKYRYIRFKDSEFKRYLYMWYLEKNRKKAAILQDNVKRFYEIKDKFTY